MKPVRDASTLLRGRRRLSELYADTEGAFAMLYSLVFVAVLLMIGLAVDYSYEVQIKYQLDLAADAAGIAATQAWAITMQNGAAAVAAGTERFSDLEIAADAAAVTAGTHAFSAQAGYLSGTATPTVVPNDSTSTTVANASTTVSVTYTTSVPTFFVRIAPISDNSVAVGGTSNAAVQISPYVQVYLILDTSASMTVGSSASDVEKVVAWNNVNGAANHVFYGGTVGPCGFACHDEANLTIADMAAGETNAHAAGATTRFDVSKLALINDPTGAYNTYVPAFGEGLLPYIRDKYDSSQSTANLATFTYNLFAFNNDIATATDGSQYYVTNIANSAKATLASDIADNIVPGFMTHLNWTVLPKLSLTGTGSLVGTSGTGSSGASPRKFIILVTDGMTSDRDWDLIGSTGTSAGEISTITQYNASNPTYNTTQTNGCTLWSSAYLYVYGATPGISGTPINECYKPVNNTQATCSGTSAACAQNYTTLIFPQAQNGIFTATPSGNWHAWNGTYTVGVQAPIDEYLSMDGNGQFTIANSLGFCNTIKTTNNATLAILETPYVQLNGQSPSWSSYESNGQGQLYPNGPAAQSALTTALQNCATTGYYYQATSDAQISTGFQTLFDQFVSQYAHLTR